MKFKLFFVLLIAALLALGGCAGPLDDANGDGGSGGGKPLTDEAIIIRFIDAGANPLTGLELEFAPNDGSWSNDDFSAAKKYVTDASGTIRITLGDLNCLLYEFSGGEEGRAVSRLTYQGKKIAGTVSLYDGFWDDDSMFPLMGIEVGCSNCEGGYETIGLGETAILVLEEFVYLIPAPPGEVFEIPGGDCPIPEAVEREFALPEGCVLSDAPKSEWFFDYDVFCDSDVLLDLGCAYSEDDYETTESGGGLVRTGVTDKTLIECSVPDWAYHEEIGYGEQALRYFDWHPGPVIASFYLGYDPSTGELVRITDWAGLFSFLAPIYSEEQAWAGAALAASDDIFCQFRSSGFPPEPPEGFAYEGEVYEREVFHVPKESISVSSVEAVDGGFRAHLLMETQGCPCYISYYERSFDLSTAGEITNTETRWVYSAQEGCIC